MTLDEINTTLDPLFPGLMGTRVTGECTPFHRGRTTMVWQTVIRNEAGKTLAVVSQTQMVIPA